VLFLNLDSILKGFEPFTGNKIEISILGKICIFLHNYPYKYKKDEVNSGYMECLECNTWFQVSIGICSSAAIAIIISYLFRYHWIPEPEKILNRNTEFTRQKLINHLDEVNYWKDRIFTIFEEIDGFDPYKSHGIQLTEYQWNQIDYAKTQIINGLKNIENLRKISSTILLEEYIVIQKYMASLTSFVIYTSNIKFHISFILKELEFARYYAKLIMELIDKKYLINFNNHWQESFNSVGGISKIHRPKLEPGDIVSIHHNFREELFYIDAQHSEIMMRLQKIDRDVDLICEKFDVS